MGFLISRTCKELLSADRVGNKAQLPRRCSRPMNVLVDLAQSAVARTALSFLLRAVSDPGWRQEGSWSCGLVLKPWRPQHRGHCEQRQDNDNLAAVRRCAGKVSGLWYDRNQATQST